MTEGCVSTLLSAFPTARYLWNIFFHVHSVRLSNPSSHHAREAVQRCKLAPGKIVMTTEHRPVAFEKKLHQTDFPSLKTQTIPFFPSI